MSDPDRGGDDGRPHVPDPQQDRHVAFPDDRGATTAPPLPPEAWAPPAPSEAAPAPRRYTGSPGRPLPPPAPPGVVTRANRMPRWLPFVIAVPVLFGVANHGTEVQVSSDDGVYSMEADGSDVAMSDSVRTVTDTAAIAPRLVGSPTVTPWSPTDTTLRVEVVSDDATTGTSEPRDITISSESRQGVTGRLGISPLTLPAAYDVPVGRNLVRLEVTATASSAEGVIQCRIYSGPDLVAIETGSSAAVCTLTPSAG